MKTSIHPNLNDAICIFAKRKKDKKKKERNDTVKHFMFFFSILPIKKKKKTFYIPLKTLIIFANWQINNVRF